MAQAFLAVMKILLRQLFAGAGIVVLVFTAIFSYGDHPLFDFNSVRDFIEGLFRLAKSGALLGMAYALIRVWGEAHEREIEVENLRRRIEKGRD